jgi:hypothetical protein
MIDDAPYYPFSKATDVPTAQIEWQSGGCRIAGWYRDCS